MQDWRTHTKKFLGQTTILKPCFHCQSPSNSIAQFPLFMLNFGMKCTLKFTAVVSALSRKSNSCCYLCYRTDIGLKSQLSPVPKHPICLPTRLSGPTWVSVFEGSWRQGMEIILMKRCLSLLFCVGKGDTCAEIAFCSQCHCFSED